MGFKDNKNTGTCNISARLAGGALAALLAMGGSAWAQLDEVVVTAERRVSNLQDVPVAVTALTGEEIDRADIHDPASLQFKVPNFNFSAFSPGQAIFSLRGISSNDDGAGTENSVSVFLDDVYFGRISNAAFDFFDVEQVEVLRGPQGTLWGKNAIGGTINITSVKPSMDEWITKGKIDLGEYNTQNIGGYVTGPIAENVAIKVSLNSRNREGFVTNVLDGVNQGGEGDLLDDNSTNYRVQLLWDVSDRTSILLTGARQNTDNNDIARIPIPNQNPAATEPRQGLETRQAFIDAGGSENSLRSVNPSSGFSRSDSEVYSLKLTSALNNGELTYIFADYSTLADWEMDSVGAATLALIDDIYDNTEATSHELRWAGALSDNLSLVAGAFYLEEDTDRTEQFIIVRGGDDRSPVAGTPASDDTIDGYRQINETESTAVFAHFDWQFAPNWSLSAGARWTEDEKSIVSFSQNGSRCEEEGGFCFIINGDIGNVANATGGVSASDSWDDVSPKVSLNWSPQDDMLIYASWASGFKSGGFGAAPATVAEAENLALEPEEAISIELGFKAELLDNTLRVNAAVFETDYESLQYQRFGPLLIAEAGGTAVPGVADVAVDTDSFGQFRTINSGDAEITGFEAEFTWAANENLMLNASYGYLDTEQDVNFRQYFSTDPGRDVIVTRPLNRAPENQYSFGLVYDWLTPWGAAVFSADYTYSDEARADVVDDFAVEDERELVDATLSWKPNDSDIRFVLWGKNLTDERYFAHVYTIGRGVIGKLGDPRVIGASLAWEFN